MTQEILYTSATILAFFYVVVFSKLYFFKNAPKVQNNTFFPVSVIICARNAAHQLKENLPKILAQQYPDFEVVLVNDASNDTTAELLLTLAREFPRLKVVTVSHKEKTSLGKKNALSKGIAAAKFEHLLLTDADCEPSSAFWLEKMAGQFSGQLALVLGVSPYRKRRGLLNAMVRYETGVTAIQYLSYALWDFPYMGVGRNMAYTKALFALSGGLSAHADLPSGDDDLLVQKAEKYATTTICLDKDALTFSDTPENWSAWWRQKTRHYSTGVRYKFFHRFFLGMFLLAKLAFYLAFFILLVQQNLTFSTLMLSLATIFITTFSVMSLNQKVQVGAQWYLTPLLDPLYTLSTILMGLIATFRKSKHWS